MLLMLPVKERNEVSRSKNDGGVIGIVVLGKKMQKRGFVGGTITSGR